jgi:predicted AlkP superfamily pyrophosphatase or phosphodiesterase
MRASAAALLAGLWCITMGLPTAPARAVDPQLRRQKPPPAVAAPSKPRRTADLVVLVSLDGFRPDIMGPSTPALHKLYLQGASPHVARTITKSATLPSHASMVSGTDPAKHGLNFNAFKPDRGAIQRPTVFSVAHGAGMPTAMFVGKHKLKHLLANTSDAQFTMVGMRCNRLIDGAVAYLREAKQGLVFLHFSDPDSAGHRYGWMTEPYLEAAKAADHCLDRVIETIERSGRKERTLLLVTADHGGHNRNHGTRMEVDQRIPWFAWGAGVRRGRISREVHTTDTAATVLAALGLKLPQDMQGTPVSEAFTAGLGPAGMSLVGKPIAR